VTTAERHVKLKEYMESEFGITPENIDKKLEEIKQEFFKRIDNQNVKEVIQC